MKYLLTAFATILVTSVSYADTKVGGFVDAQFQYMGNQGEDAATRTFLVNDGALYFSHGAGNSSVMVDVPFAISSDGKSSYGGMHSQAYVSHRVGDVTLSLGKMDSFYGFESNDSVQNTFANDTGLAYALSPQGHLGMAAQYASAGGVGLNLVVAQEHYFLPEPTPPAAGQADTADDAPDEKNMEYGAELTYAADMWNISAGYFMGTESKSYMEAKLGVNMGQLDVILGYNTRDLKMEEKANVMFANLGYAINDESSLAFRGEMAKNNGNHSEMQLTFGPSHKYSSNLTIRADFTYNSVEKQKGDEKVNSNSVLLAGVYSL